MKFRSKISDVGSIQHLYRVLVTIGRLSDGNVLLRIAPARFCIFSKMSPTSGSCFVIADIKPDMLFDEFLMTGYASDANEIYLELKVDTLIQSLKIPSQKAKCLKIKLTNKAGPSLTVEAELPSVVAASRRSVFDVPVQIVHRNLWASVTPAEEIPSSISCYMPPFKSLKAVVDRMRLTRQHNLQLSVNKYGELRIRVGDNTEGYSACTRFPDIEFPEADDRHEPEQITDEEREEVQRKGEFYSSIVDLRTFAAFLTALQFPTTRMRCDVRHHKSLLFSMGTSDFCLRYFVPAVDSGNY
ncbi:hypothetical protein RvY_14967 [Ramazzottius varieornatus]|uniref:Checkpoint protein n=1 Tax=Ramazzottius varieornatus TaxID=947166 RepID=A0A1D1W0A8_RAMVA|nr:hypothetical protein RvY_14967 [Ramazzottius varieornatus]